MYTLGREIKLELNYIYDLRVATYKSESATTKGLASQLPRLASYMIAHTPLSVCTMYVGQASPGKAG